MRISDWRSDVCSSDLIGLDGDVVRHVLAQEVLVRGRDLHADGLALELRHHRVQRLLLGGVDLGEVDALGLGDRKSVVSGKSVSVRVDLGGRRMITKKNTLMTSV